MEKRKPFLLKLLSLVCLLMFLGWALPSEAPARSGRGGSGGKSPGTTKPVGASKTTAQTEPSKPTGLATTAADRKAEPYSSRSTDSFGQGPGGGIWGGLTGGMLARWLFFGPGAEEPGAGDSYSFGLLDLILLAGLGLIIYWLIARTRRQQAAAVPGTQNNPVETGPPPPDEPEPPPPPKPKWDLETGLQYIEQSDPLFSVPKFKDQALDYFFKIQGAWMDRDLSTVKHLLTREMFDLLQADAEKMRRDGLVNRLQILAVQGVNLTEAWQESGQDYLTVRIQATLLDYTINENSREIIAGSKTEPVRFEEYWTFTRPLGNHPWQLSAINQAE